ncbi:hypothetical protein COLO4_12801 [Corchorus olitorius]|uniref:DEAD-box ATP-dependent RNA helicase FANCM n=1 Tax=Corchorus olitorius TaxID=93759 RepID=A0A1R3JZU2_9ROSI|nr:hypothetical protein COLO4_12801 [Corchorus olitorius]
MADSMASDPPLQVIGEDDEDEFDWEAAVREIDKACQTSKPSSNNSSSHFPPPPSAHIPKRNAAMATAVGTSKQSTLDKFIARVGPRPASDKHQTVEPEVDVEGDYRVASVDIDMEAAKTWIYPVNVPLRDYQLAITRTALFSNTLVALPTGLGKTLIAAVVIYNYFRWFPEDGGSFLDSPLVLLPVLTLIRREIIVVSPPPLKLLLFVLCQLSRGIWKIVFAAPSRPLVMQQIEACHNVVGIPQEWTIDMTGQISPTRRASFWKTKRVFFVTPQVLEKDIQSGTCLAKYLVCLVIDEAHRALGNYSYCVAVRELMAMPVQLRILALTATPGSKQLTIQQIIDNLYISKLEYRNESDHDVSPYVHNRKIEVIEVPLGQDAAEVNNRLLEVIRPYVARLHAIGLVQNRDYQTLSPVDLLNSRDKFRQAPPPDLPHVKHGEVEVCFAVLITLYHIRKLLSSHGIRLAYEMLEEKLRQGHFSRLMSKNEDIMKAKLLMQRSLSHGAPSPKLSKMLQILVKHFETKDPKNSRVIIFSNFRGSVRDIMNALASIGDLVKATEFIGQSSGKALKGQSQKVQQAVLEKFRAGGYNVIVATSIGEEGLDIMEVDLVICFDANVSPLRMIQRMGRTGRKHDGRIPHICKPEVQYVELSIEQFVPRGKKLKDDQAIETPPFREKLTVAETELIAKYFHPTSESTWRPSLIAFPDFQASPSKVFKVKHSCRTEMLIESMQYLQGLTFPGGNGDYFVEDEVSSGDCFGVGIVEQHDSGRKDSLVLDNCPAANTQLGGLYPAESSMRISRTKEKLNGPDCGQKCPQAHSYLFGSDFVSVDALGNILIISVPSLHFEDLMHSKHESPRTKEMKNSLKEDANHVKISAGTMLTEAVPNVTASQTQSIKDDTLSIPGFCEINSKNEKMLDGAEKIPETPGGTCETPDIEEIKAPPPLADECYTDLQDTELSPRLTNLIKIGVVPESPITESGTLKDKIRNEPLIPDLASPAKFCTGLLLRSSSPVENEGAVMDNSPCGRKVLVVKDKMTPLVKMNPVFRCSPASPLETKTPLAHLTNSSGSKSWHLSSGEKVEMVNHVRKFKRLRKVGDCGIVRSSKGMMENSIFSIEDVAKSYSDTSPIRTKHGRGKRKQENDARTFIDEEAESMGLKPNKLVSETVVMGDWRPFQQQFETFLKLYEEDRVKDRQDREQDRIKQQELAARLEEISREVSTGKREERVDGEGSVNRGRRDKRPFGADVQDTASFEYIAVEVELHHPRDLSTAMCLARLYERRGSSSKLASSQVKHTDTVPSQVLEDNNRVDQIEEHLEDLDIVENPLSNYSACGQAIFRGGKVSTDAEISADEEDDNESYDDSFIDDRINPTAGSSQTESGIVDMMAIYRRSLLSQSPMVGRPTSSEFSPNCVASTSKENGSGFAFGKSLYSPQVSESIYQPTKKNTESFQMEKRVSSESIPCRINGFPKEYDSMHSRKRKLSFLQLESIPAINLDREFLLQSEVQGKESSKGSQQPQVEKITVNKNEFDDDDDDDDQFYASLDLDAVEAQATLLLRHRSESSIEKQENIAPSNLQHGGLQGSPSFDLGIW